MVRAWTFLRSDASAVDVWQSVSKRGDAEVCKRGDAVASRASESLCGGGAGHVRRFVYWRGDDVASRALGSVRALATGRAGSLICRSLRTSAGPRGRTLLPPPTPDSHIAASCPDSITSQVGIPLAGARRDGRRPVGISVLLQHDGNRWSCPSARTDVTDVTSLDQDRALSEINQGVDWDRDRELGQEGELASSSTDICTSPLPMSPSIAHQEGFSINSPSTHGKFECGANFGARMMTAMEEEKMDVGVGDREERGVRFYIGDAFYRAESSLSRDLATLAAALYREKHGRLTVIDAMGGCGVRATRYLKQAGADFVWANDASTKTHVALIRNLSSCGPVTASSATGEEPDGERGEPFKVKWGMEAAVDGVAPDGRSRWRVSHDDVVRVLSARRVAQKRSSSTEDGVRLEDDYFDIVDVDSFGSDTWMFSSALQAVRYGGMVYATCTDGVTAGGHQPLKSLGSFGALVRPLPYSNEIGIRMLIGGLVREAAGWGLHAWPVFSHYSYHGPVFRAMMKIEKKKKPHSWPAEWYAFIGYCHSCGESRVVQWEDLGNVFCTCPRKKAMALTGPLWVGPLHNEEDVREMKVKAEAWGWLDGEQKKRGGNGVKGKRNMDLGSLLEIMLEECQGDLMPYYIGLDKIARFGDMATPRRDRLIQALREEGYLAGRSHIEANAVKANVPMSECIRITRDVLYSVTSS